MWVQHPDSLIKHQGRPVVPGSGIDANRRRRAEAELRASEKQLKLLVALLLQRQELERKTIALKIHEDIAQTLSAVKLRVESMLDGCRMESGSVSDNLMPIINDIKNTIDVTRQITRRLRPIILDNLGLTPAILALCRETEEADDIGIDKQIDIDEGRVPADLKIVIYRILEEILIIATRQHRAESVRISLQLRDDRIVLSVRESGTRRAASDRVPPEPPEPSLDIAALKSRAESQGGSFAVEPVPAGGSAMEASWPLTKHGQG